MQIEIHSWAQGEPMMLVFSLTFFVLSILCIGFTWSQLREGFWVLFAPIIIAISMICAFYSYEALINFTGWY